MSIRAGEEKARRKADPREAMLDQIELLVDEAEALGQLLGPMPDELIHGRPLDTMPSVADMLMGIVVRDRTVRCQNILAFMTEDAPEFRVDEPDGAGDGSGMPVEQILHELRAERIRLVALVREMSDDHWSRSVDAGGLRLTALEYFGSVVQADAATLRQIAERIFESRPAGSPGLSRQ